jgi:hypothetical protein
MQDNTAQDGVRKLMHTLLTGPTSNAPFDDENDQLQSFLSEAAHLTSDDLTDLGDGLAHGPATRRNRSRLRYLAALLPGKSLHELADTIHYIMDNSHVSITDVRNVLRGGRRDVPIEKIQEIGALLNKGESLRATAKATGVSYDTVERIESFIGIAEARRLKLVDFACDAVRESWSVRTFAAKAGIPKSTAHVIMGRAREVLVELGEVMA